MRKQLFIGAIISYITIGVNILTGLFYTPWMIHVIGDSEYALYSLALSVISIFMTDFGLSSATTRFLSNYYANDENDNANRFLGITLKLYLIIDIVLFLVLFILFFKIEQIYTRLTINEIQIFKGLYSIVAFYSIISFPLLNLNGILIAKEKFISVKLCSLLQKVLTVFFIVSALLTGGNVYALVLANAGTGIIFSIIKIFLVKRTGIRIDIRYKNRNMRRELLTFSIWNTAVQFSQRLIFSLAPTLLAMYADSIEITYFSLASTIEGYIWIIGDAVNGMFMPRIARLDLDENGANEKITDLMCKVGRFQILIIGMVVITFGLIGRDFILVWMGKGYEKVTICALLIIIPALLYIPQQIGKTAMMVRNKVKLEAVVYIIMIVIYLPTGILLSESYGVIGTSIAILIAYMVRSIAMTVIYQIKLKLDMKKFYISVYGRWGLSGICSSLASGILLQYITKDGYAVLIFKGVLCVMVYIIIAWFVFLNPQNRNDVLYRLRKK